MGAVTSDEEKANYDPTYRQRDVDDTLVNHEKRISRLEKVALVGLGYAIATAPEIVSQLSSVLL